MKRNKRIIFLVLLVLVLSVLINIKVGATASFTLKEKESRDLGYGVSVDTVKGTSKSTFWESYWGGSTNADNRGQTIYTASINPSSPAYVVQWTVFPNGNTDSNENEWGVSNLSTIAKDYEAKHPGKKVLAAINNWLSDTNSNNVGELDGVQICDGLNYRVSDKQGDSAFAHEYIARPFILGFDKDGNIIFDDDYNSSDYTDMLVLSFYNGVDQDKTYLDLSIDKINTEPSDGEIAIYFSNYGLTLTNISGANVYKFKGTVRHDNASRTEFVERDAFAKGKFIEKVDNIDFNNVDKGTFFIASKNANFNSLDFSNKELVCQYELLGDLKDIVGATTYYYHIVRDGISYNNNYNDNAPDTVDWAKGHQINNEIHPRSALFIKEDGSIGISVIDGRRQDQDMTGMDYEDMANFYKSYYNAKEVFNYDGGGSSAIVIANASGGFDCINNPSDGHQRGVANATLIVVDEEPFKVSCNEDETNKIILHISDVKSDVEKIYATLNDKCIEATKNNDVYEIVFDSLTKETIYDIKMSWTIKNDTTIYTGANLQFETASQYAYIDSYEYSFTDDGILKIIIKVNDEGNSFNKGTVSVGGETQTFKETNVELEFYDIDKTIDNKVVIRINSKIEIKSYQKITEFTIKGETQGEEDIDTPVDPPKIKVNINWKMLGIYIAIGFFGIAFAVIVYLISKSKNKKSNDSNDSNEDKKTME